MLSRSPAFQAHADYAGAVSQHRNHANFTYACACWTKDGRCDRSTLLRPDARRAGATFVIPFDKDELARGTIILAEPVSGAFPAAGAVRRRRRRDPLDRSAASGVRGRALPAPGQRCRVLAR